MRAKRPGANGNRGETTQGANGIRGETTRYPQCIAGWHNMTKWCMCRPCYTKMLLHYNLNLILKYRLESCTLKNHAFGFFLYILFWNNEASKYFWFLEMHGWTIPLFLFFIIDIFGLGVFSWLYLWSLTIQLYIIWWVMQCWKRPLAKCEWKFRVASKIHFILARPASRNLKMLVMITGSQL